MLHNKAKCTLLADLKMVRLVTEKEQQSKDPSIELPAFTTVSPKKLESELNFCSNAKGKTCF